MTIGEKIKSLRLRDNMTQAELGNILNMSRNNVSKWETNVSVPSIEVIKELSKVFGIDVNDLVDDSIILDEGLLDTREFLTPHFSFIIGIVAIMFVSIYALFVNDSVNEVPYIPILLSFGVIFYMLLRFTQKIIPMKYAYLIVPGLFIGYLLLRQILLISSGFGGDFFLWETFVNIALFGFTVIIVIAYRSIEYFSKKSFSLRLLYSVKNIVVPLVLMISFFYFLSFEEMYYHRANNILVNIKETTVFIIVFVPSILTVIIFLFLTKQNIRLRTIFIVASLGLWVLISIIAQNYDLITPAFVFDFQWVSLFSLLIVVEFFVITSFKELQAILK
jgi:transcriptional regulator with XRE-family HTH domain